MKLIIPLMKMLVDNTRKYARASYLALLVINLMLISGCGFELRSGGEDSTAGSANTLSARTKISISGGSREFNEQLSQRLQQSGFMLVNAASEITLSISKSESKRRVRNIDTTGLALSYDHTYTLSYQVLDSNGTILQPSTTNSRQSTLDYDPSQLLQFEEEAAFLKKQMMQEIISQLLRRLSQTMPGGGIAH